MRTLAEHLTRIRTKLVDPNADARLGWTDARLTMWLNQHRDQFAQDTKLLFERTDSVLNNAAYFYIKDYAEQLKYPVPDDTAAVDRCEWRNVMIPHIPLKRLEESDPSWEAITGDVQTYSLDGNFLYKTRIPAVTSDDFVMERYVLPTKLEAGSDFDGRFPLWADDAVEYATAASAYQSPGEGQDKTLAQHYKTRYDEMVERAKDRRNRNVKRAFVIGGGATTVRRLIRPQLPSNYGQRVR